MFGTLAISEIAVKDLTGSSLFFEYKCGLVVNPDALRNQVEGLIVQTLSRTMHEEVKFDKSRVTSTDWSTYPILRFAEAPPIEIALIFVT